MAHFLAERFATFTMALGHEDCATTGKHLDAVRAVRLHEMERGDERDPIVLLALGDLEMWLGHRFSSLTGGPARDSMER